MNRNFAALFSVIDIVFGAWYLPRRASVSYGLGHGAAIATSLLRQLAIPSAAERRRR